MPMPKLKSDVTPTNNQPKYYIMTALNSEPEAIGPFDSKYNATIFLQGMRHDITKERTFVAIVSDPTIEEGVKTTDPKIGGEKVKQMRMVNMEAV